MFIWVVIYSCGYGCLCVHTSLYKKLNQIKIVVPLLTKPLAARSRIHCLPDPALTLGGCVLLVSEIALKGEEKVLRGVSTKLYDKLHVCACVYLRSWRRVPDWWRGDWPHQKAVLALQPQAEKTTPVLTLRSF